MRDSRVTAGRRWRLRLSATLAMVVAIAAVIAILLATRSPSPANGSGARNQASGSATVQRRDLVQTDTESGTLSYANPRTVYNRLSGTITWLPVVGQVITPGQALYRIGNEPVILMDGTTPAYRDLGASDSAGPDILELNRNLVALGFDAAAIVVDDEWQAATTEGVDLLQESLGETATGSLMLGHVVFLPGNQVISTVDATVGSDGGGSGTGNSAAVYDPPAGGSSEFASLTTTTGSPPGQPTGSPPGQPTGRKPKRHRKPSANAETVAALTALLKAEIAQLKAEQARGGSPNGSGAGSGSGSGNRGGSGKGNGNRHSNGNGNANHGTGHGNGSGSGNGNGNGNGNGGSGGGGGGASAILQTSSTKLVATVDLDATKQSEAKLGEKVTVELPNGSTVNGKVTAVSPVAQSSRGSGNGNGNGQGNGDSNGNSGGNNGNGSSGATIPVTITLSGHRLGAGLDRAAVSVNFAQQVADNVLSVPVTALLATAGGGYSVQEAAAPHALIPVTVGLFAAGYVQISGPGIYPGLAVTDSQG